MDNIYGDLSVKMSDIVTTGEKTVGHNYRRKLRRGIVKQMMMEPMKYPNDIFLIQGLPDVSTNTHLKLFFESAINTDILKVLPQDAAMVSDILKMRMINNDYIVDLTLGEVLLYMAQDLKESYGGSRKYWLLVMFELIGLTKAKNGSNFGDILSDVSKHLHWKISGGYGIFADREQRITNKPIGFSEELRRFKEILG